MDCLSAQQLLSESFDEEMVDATKLAEAQRHCGECAECTAFARGLLSLRLPGPVAGEPLIAAVMKRIEDEAARQKAAAEPVADAAGGTDDAGAADTGEASVVPIPDRGRAPGAPVRPRLTGWRRGVGLAAAAALVLGFGLLTQYGVSLMTNSFSGGRTASDGLQTAAPSNSTGAGEGTGESVPSAPYAADKAAESRVEAPFFVAFKGRVYRMKSARETSGTVPAALGTARTARESAGPAGSVTVYADPASATDGILLSTVTGGKTSYTAFTPVTRTFQGRTYIMTVSSDIERFGDWPTLPEQYPVPVSANGSPIFDDAGKDDLGVTVFAPRGRGPEAGFAIAPSMPPTDPTAGNPNWTWWEPLS